MARRPAGLNPARNLSQLLAEAEQEINRPVNKYDITYDTTDDGAGGLQFTATNGLRSVIPSGDDFGPYFVSQAAQYYQGPTASTRVAAHMFIPLQDNWMRRLEMGLDDANTLRGNIYVRFQRRTKESPEDDVSGKPGNLWKYGPCSLSDYRRFREAASKGRAVNSLQAFGHGNADYMDQSLPI